MEKLIQAMLDGGHKSYVIYSRVIHPNPCYSEHDVAASMLPSYVTWRVFTEDDDLIYEGVTDFRV